MKRIIFIVLALAFAVMTSAQNSDVQKFYFRSVEKQLGMSPLIWGCRVRPSFSPIYSVGCFMDRKGPLLLASASKGKVRRLRISQQQADDFAGFIRMASETIRKKPKSDVLVEDGIWYVFLSDGQAVENSPLGGYEYDILNQIADSIHHAVTTKDKKKIGRILDNLETNKLIKRPYEPEQTK